MSKKPDLSALFGANDTSSFLGLEKCENLELLNASLALIGIPCATPYQSVGPYCKNAPQVLRASIASLSANIDRHNFDLNGQIFPEDHPRAVDCGDLSYDEENFQTNRDNIFKSIKTILSKKVFQLLLVVMTPYQYQFFRHLKDRRNIQFCKLMPTLIGENLIWMKH